MNNQIVDNNTYNLLMALSENLEAYNAYQKYAQDGNQQLWQQLAQQKAQTVQLLQQELAKTMGNQSQMQTGQNNRQQGQIIEAGQLSDIGQQNYQGVTGTSVNQASNGSEKANYTNQNTVNQQAANQTNASNNTTNNNTNANNNNSDWLNENQPDELTMPNPDQRSGYANENYAPYNK